MRDKRTGQTDLQVVECEPNRKLTWEYASGRFKGAKATRNMETIEGKTRLTWTLDAKLGGFYKLVAPFATRMARRSITTQLGNVKRLVESESQS
jgi:carbon monoxide dehydrogenase subunit G